MKKIDNAINIDNALPPAPSASVVILDKMRKKLELAGEELLRMEDEGGAPLNSKQVTKVAVYHKVSNYIKCKLQAAKKYRDIDLIVFFTDIRQIFKRKTRVRKKTALIVSLRPRIPSTSQNNNKTPRTNACSTTRK